MATVVGVGMQMTASAAGMTKGLSEADRALQLLQKIVDQNQQSLKRFTGEADKTSQSLNKLTKGVSVLSTIEIGRVLVSGFQTLASTFTSAAQNVLTLAGNVSQSLDSLNDLSARTGIGVEALQGYALAAKMAGVDTEAFGSAVQKLAVNIGKSTPGGELDKALKAINLSVAELRVLAPEKQFSVIGEAISRLPTAADRAAAAVAVFGKQGAALAPLFREGAASIDELRARAERLGIIVSEAQINNVAEMNDAFDLVRATVEGITGKILGNLAPAVTKVVEDLLRFVETYQDATGAVGGEAIANSITDAFLNGAKLFVGVLERFAEIAKQVAAALGVDLRSEAEKELAAMQAQLAAGLAPQNAVDGLGGFVTELDKEWSSKFDDLKAKVAEEAKQSAFAASKDFLDQFDEEVKKRRAPQFKIETNIEETRDRFETFFNGIVDQESAITDAYREFEAAVAAVADPLNMTAEEIARIKQAQEVVNGLLTEEQRQRLAAADATRTQAEADEKRIESLLKTSDAAGKLEADLAAVERERQRIAAAGGEDAQARLAQLDALQAKLEEQQQAVEQGFGQGFEQAFQGADKALDAAIEKASEFGLNGAAAAQEFADAVQAAKEQVKDGFFSKDDFDAELERQRNFFDERIKLEQAAIAARKKADEEAARLRLQQEELVNGLIQQQQFGGDAERIRAAENLVAINAEIVRAEQAIADARAAGDQQGAQAAAARLAQLDQVKAKEEDIANGQAKAREAFFKQQEEAAKAQEQAQQKYLEEQRRIAEEQQKAAGAEFKRQSQRIAALNTLGQQSVNTADFRTTEGANLVIGLAASAQDPQLIEARLQTKLLKQVVTGLAANLNRIGLPAYIPVGLANQIGQ